MILNAVKPKAVGLPFVNELRGEEIIFSETVPGIYQCKFNKPKDFINGYCQIYYDDDILCMQDKRSCKFFFADPKWKGDIQEVDNGKSFIITLHKLPKAKKYQFYYRFDTETELGGSIDVFLGGTILNQ